MHKAYKGHLENILLLTIVGSGLLVVTGCGKRQTRGAIGGAAAGALVGDITSRSPLLGAAIGGLVGSAIGASKDQKVERRRHAVHIRSLQIQNKRLSEKWCNSCGTSVYLPAAQSCSQCGDQLIIEKYCAMCRRIFAPNCKYNYCPYCKEGIYLAGR